MKKKISRQARWTYFGLLLGLGVLMVVGPAMAGSIQFTSVAVSQQSGPFLSPGPNWVAVNGNPASVAITNTTITCFQTSGPCGFSFALTAVVTGLSVGDLISLGLDGTWSGGAATTLRWQTSSFGALLDTGVQNATAAFNFTNGPIAITEAGIVNMIATLTISGLGSGQSIVFPSSAIVNAVTPTPGVPEPGSMALMAAGFGAMGLGAWRRRRRQK